jgi:hypothetical protein
VSEWADEEDRLTDKKCVKMHNKGSQEKENYIKGNAALHRLWLLGRVALLEHPAPHAGTCAPVGADNVSADSRLAR